MSCPRCGASALPNARFCDACGAPLPAAAAFRSAAPAARAAGPASMAAGFTMRRPTRSPAALACIVLVPLAGLSAVVGGVATLADDGRPAVVALIVVALICMGGAVGELLGMRELLLIGAGTAMTLGASALVRATELLFVWDSAPVLAILAWAVAALVAPALAVLVALGSLPVQREGEPPVVFPAVALGSGLLCTVALVLPGSFGALAGPMSPDQPVVMLMVLLYAALPALAGTSAIAARSRAAHMISFGTAAWFLLDWVAKGAAQMQERALFLFAAAGLLFALATIGGGLVLWHAGVPHFEKPRDYALPIGAAGAVLLVMLTGLLG